MLVVFFSTFSSKKAAASFAKKVVGQKLAACINILPQIESHYFWEGKLHNDKEFLIIGKTTHAKFKKIKSQIKKLHSYKVPELICFQIKDGNKAYLSWLSQN